MTISGGFQTDDRDRNDFPNDNAAAHQFNYILLTLHGSRAPAALKTVSVVGPDNYVLRPRQLDKRYGCQYEFYFDSLFCYNRGSYALIVEGVDFLGNLFRRVAPFECVNQPGPTTDSPVPSTPQPTNPTSCANGGVLNSEGLGKGTCICQDHWTGYDCSQAVCINGGTLLKGKCFCSVGFEGVHCEQVKCEPNANYGFGVDRPTLVFIVRARSSQNLIMQQVQKAIDEVVANLQFDPTYLARFHLVIFNDHAATPSKSCSERIKSNADISHNMRGFCSLTERCPYQFYRSILQALTDVSLTQGSTVYVITDAMADDQSEFSESILQMNSFWRATINFIYVQPAPEDKCIADISDPGFRAFDDVANRFGGMAWQVQDRNKVHDVLYGHMNSILYKSQLMLTLDREECSKGLAKVIQLEKNTETLVFVAKGRGFSLDITSPDGRPVKPRTIVKEGIFTVWRWSTPLAGAYMVRAVSDTPTTSCSLRAYQASDQSLSSNSQTEAFWAMSTDVDTDAMMYQPTAGMDNYPVFHIEDFGDDYDHAFSFLNMYAVRDGVEKEVYAANGLYRGGCSFQFYFPSFRCRPNENLHYEFNLRGDEGFYVQRAGVMTCFNYIPTPAAPTDCQNGGVKYNETCLCQSHYEGEHCQTLICENGGTSVFGVCQCAAGWAGPFCIFPQCPSSGPLPSYGYGVDMAFLVEISQKGIQQIDQLVKMLPDIIRDVGSQHTEWIDRLVLIGYDWQGVLGMVDMPMSNTKKFFDTLYDWAASNPTDGLCHVRIWKALDTLLNDRKDGNTQRVLPDRSIINIIEASIPNDGDRDLISAISEELLERSVITNVFLSNDWNTEEGFPCGGKTTDFRHLEQIVRRGDGMIYTLGNGDLGRAVRMIPTLFSSSIVYKYHSDDCGRQVKVFFPLDAYTQTVTAVVYGKGAALELRRHDGERREGHLISDDSRIDILNDDRNQVVEFRNPCDSDWEPVSQYCMYYSRTLRTNFDDANALCQSMGGFMADDLNNDKNEWLNSEITISTHGCS
ncbi:hypothetical protein PENTCL1PPCAC_16684 [Pristionchus entomophagus]|uniref:EGF-like domain-containing protein n=1 Tax=Pristionchus entomophagus TaxID=358040 RepID=A0AAV5TJI1_9BILA|nr:hypothetical protein PENTCL1PPCAC_16684 [Pristionchus entomophagus]